MASALSAISKEEINFLRVANLLIRHSPKAVRILFNREFNPNSLTSVLSKNRIKLDKLKKKHVITQTQWSLLFPSGSLPDSSNFDLTLMVCLLRNLTKIAIQDQPPQPSDLSEGAAVSRIKFYRNQIAHSDSGAMSDSEFSKTFDEVSMAIEIICPSMKSDCKTLKDADIDHSVHDIYVEFVKNEKQMEEMKQQQEELVAKVEILNVERQNIEAIQTEEISDWKNKLEKFYVTEAATRLIKVVNNNQCTIITGVPGSGKSSLAYYVAIYMEETEGYTVLPTWLPSELIKMANSNAKQLFVFDDVFGKYSLNESNLNSWESETRRMTKLLKNKVLKVMVTCRSYLYDKVRDSLSSQSFEHFNMQSDEITLSLIERKNISKLYLTEDTVCHLNDETFMMYNFFPLLCVMFKEKNMDNADFFQNPRQFIEHEIGNFRNKRNDSLIALALLVLSNNSIEKECLQIGKDKYDTMLQDLFDETDTRRSSSKTSIFSSLQNLKSMYLDETESFFCTKHDKIFDIISHTLGNFIIRCILRHGKSAFISSRCQLISLNEPHGDCTIMITDELETMYFERIMKDIEEGQNWEVFASIQMKFEHYRKDFMEYLEKMSPKFTSSKTDFSSPLHVTASKGYYDISKYLLKNNRKLIMNDDYKVSPLHLAIKNGHHEITDLLLNHGSEIEQTDSDGYTPLLSSCYYGYPKITEVLLKNNAMVNICVEDGWYPLHLAADNGNTDLIKLLINHKAKVNKQMNNGMTPLYLACNNGHLPAVKLLIDNKANVNKCEQGGWSSIHVACAQGFDDIVEVLIVKGADVNILDNFRETPLSKACIHNHINIAKLLLKHGVAINQANKNENTPLHVACKKGNAAIVDLLCELGASTNQSNVNGFTPLHCFCDRDYNQQNDQTITTSATIHDVNESGDMHLIPADNSDKDIIKHLIKHAADINSATKTGKTPIFLACEHGNLEEVKMLLRLEVDANNMNKCDDNGYIDLCNEEGLTPLHSASLNGNKNIAELLIKRGAAVNKADKDGNTALLYACSELHNETALVLLENGAEVNNHDQNGRTSLHSAAEDGNTDLIKILIEHDANINVQLNNGITPIYIACEENQLEAVKLLLGYKADINKCEETGWSLLHIASHANHKEVVEYLCDHSITGVNLCTEDGNSPLTIACQNRNNEIAKILLDNGAEVNCNDVNGRTSLHSAAEDGNTELIKILIEHDADTNIQVNNGMTPIYLACHCGHLEAVKILLTYQANINKCEKSGWSPLHVASYLNHKEVVGYLCDHSAVVVNLLNKHGSPPLHLACQQGNEDIVQLLLKHGASNNHFDEEGFTPFYKACSKGNSIIVELLLKGDAAINLPDRTDRTPLYIACKNRCSDVVEILLKHGAEVDKVAEFATEEGWTPLHVSASSGDTRITELLLKNNATVIVEDRNGHTPLYYARQQKFNGIIELLVSHGAICSDRVVQNTEPKRRKRCSIQ